MNPKFHIVNINDRLSLYRGEAVPAIPKKSDYIFVDFMSDEWSYRLKSSSRELLTQAVGLKKGMKTVLDLTCGLGQDAFLLSQLGLEVRALEKSEGIFRLVEDALKRYSGLNVKRKFELIHGDSMSWMKEFESSVDVVYLDPMFPEKKKSSLPSKEMQFLQEYLGDNGSCTGLLKEAMNKDCKRWVVKRHLRSDYLDDFKPDFQIKGKAVRYDIYVQSQLRGAK